MTGERMVATRALGTEAGLGPALADAISPTEAHAILTALRDGHGEHTFVDIEQNLDASVHRSAAVRPLGRTEFADLGDRLRTRMLAANDERFRLDITYASRDDAPNFVRYVPGQGHYDWHTDLGPGHAHRKLSGVLLLSPETDFEGGQLELSGHGTIPLKQGTVCIFPSYITHRLNPVTAGERIVIATWLHGPTFR